MAEVDEGQNGTANTVHAKFEVVGRTYVKIKDTHAGLNKT